MDTYALVAVGAGVVLSVAMRRDRMATAGSAGENPSSGALSARRGQANDGEKSHLHRSCARPFAAR